MAKLSLPFVKMRSKSLKAVDPDSIANSLVGSATWLLEDTTWLEDIFREDRKKSRASDSLVPYCDLHLGSKMEPGYSWMLMQYGWDSADCNPLGYWRCLRPDCIRCYDPYYHGYFWLSRELGSRIQLNLESQKRCGRHVETPFMCVTKIGEKRRYACPFYGCDEHGETIADCVQDENLTIVDSDSTATGLSKNERKSASELKVFKAFAVAAGIQVDKESSRNAKEPHPDIQCTVGGVEHWLELGRITNEDLAERTSPKRRRPGGGFSFSQEEPLATIIDKKRLAKYETGGSPVELILYFDQHPADRSAIQRHIEKHRDALKSLITDGTFCRVWIYDSWSKTVLWTSG